MKQPRSEQSRTRFHRRVLFALPWLIFAGLLGFLAFSRTFPGFGTESDLLGGFAPEAQRFLSGEPLEMRFQPPVYSFLLAIGHLVYPDWFRVALALSLGAVLLSLWLSFAFFKREFGTWAGWGSVAGLVTSSTFLLYGIQATSDVPFLAISLATLLASHRWLTSSRGMRPAFLTGIMGGLAMLMRFNGIPLLLLGLVAWVRNDPSREKVHGFGAFGAGVIAVWLVWGAYAVPTGSPLYPTDNYANLAMTYFGEDDRLSIEDRLLMEDQFASTAQVLTHDPLTIARRYPADLYRLSREFFLHDQLLAFPLGPLSLAGVLLLLFSRPSRYRFLFIAVVAAHLLLLNLKTFEPRYHLVMVPLLGAGTGIVVERGAELIRAGPWRALVATFLIVLLTLGTYMGWRSGYRDLTYFDAELQEAIPATRALLSPDDVVVARKRHIPFHAGAVRWRIPVVDDPEELLDIIDAQDFEGSILIYFGQLEWARRPELRSLADPSTAPPSLEPLAVGERSPWVLYRYRPERRE